MKRVKPHKQRHVGLVSMLGSMLVWAVCWYVGECCFGQYVGMSVIMLVWAV